MKPRRVRGLDADASVATNAARIVRVRVDELYSFDPAVLDPEKVRELHDMRIAAKRLRYVLEIAGHCFPDVGAEAEGVARALQEVLGEIHDCDVLIPRVDRELAALRDHDALALARLSPAVEGLPATVRRAPGRARYRGPRDPRRRAHGAARPPARRVREAVVAGDRGWPAPASRGCARRGRPPAPTTLGIRWYSLLVADYEGMRTITLNRSERRNALSHALMLELRTLLDETALDSSVRVVVIDAAGPAFSAGHDLAEMDGASSESYTELFRVCSELMLAIHRLPQPVIASVRGIATAAGCQLVAACDLAIAAEGARFATPGVRIGLFCSTPMVELSRVVGRKRAMEMLLTGEPIDAATAADWGLINRVVPPAELDDDGRALARRSRSSAHTRSRSASSAFYEQLDHGLADAYELTRDVMARNAASPPAREGISAFLGKRDPVWPE